MIIQVEEAEPGEDWEVQGVRVFYGQVGPDEEHTLQLRLTDEGLIIDLVDEDGEVVATAGYDTSELEELCH